MYKERCPHCSTPFPFGGPTMMRPDPCRLYRRVQFECPACHGRLERHLRRDEKLLVGVASAALLAASLWSILAHMGLVSPVRPVSTFLYGLAIVAGAIQIRHAWIRRRFHVASEP